jgi:hypothetical protein
MRNKNKISEDEAQKHMRYLTINFNLYSIRYNKAEWNEWKAMKRKFYHGFVKSVKRNTRQEGSLI